MEFKKLAGGSSTAACASGITDACQRLPVEIVEFHGEATVEYGLSMLE